MLYITSGGPIAKDRAVKLATRLDTVVLRPAILAVSLITNGKLAKF